VRVLNLYAGVGGNRKLWENCEVVAVEYNEKIADVYKRLHPSDTVIIGDAHQYLLDHYDEFDFVWSSPPCQRNSRMVLATRHKKRRYPDLRLYEEYIFLDRFFDGLFVIENVKPYYKPLIDPARIVGRHCFWSNFEFDAEDVDRPADFINLANVPGKHKLMNWLGIHFDENIYYEGNHCPAQILRNCVHPLIGKQIFDQATIDLHASALKENR